MLRSVMWISLFAACAAPDGQPTGDSLLPTDDTSGADTGPDTGSAPDTDTNTVPPPDTVVTDLSWALSSYAGSVVIARWTQDEEAPVHVEYTFDDGIWQSSPSRTFLAGANEQVLIGIPYESTAEWRVVVEGGGAVVAGDPIATMAWPALLPRPTLTIDDPAVQLAEGKYLLLSMMAVDGGWNPGAHPFWSFILDRQGRLIWAKRTPQNHWTLFFQVAVTGDHLLLDESTHWVDFQDGDESKVHRTYLDEEIEVIATPGLHHEFVQLPDQTLAWGSKAHGGAEALVEKVVGQKDETVLWTCLDDSNFGNGCESNGLFYHEATNSYLYSFYTNSTVTEIDRSTGDSLWWAGNAPDGYAFVPAESQFDWQHGVSYTDAGTLLLSSQFFGSTSLLEYDVDQALGTLSLVWSSQSGVYAETNGQAWRLANGNTLHVVGSAGVAREVTPDDTDAWRVEWDSDYLLGHGQFVEDLYGLLKPVE